MEFDGKVVIITGSTSGIGEQTALDFAKNGAIVVVHGRDESRLNAVVQKCTEISPSKHKHLGVIADLCEDEQLKKIIDKTIEAYGKIDVLVNNASIVSFYSVEDPYLITAFDTAIRTNLRPLVVLSHFAIPHLIASKGSIVNISSIGSSKPVNCIKYSHSTGDAAKDMVTRSMALELGPKGVRVNIVSPGYTKTPIYAALGLNFEEMVVLKKQPLEKHGEPSDISRCVLFLASEKSTFITGATLQANGGINDTWSMT